MNRTSRRLKAAWERYPDCRTWDWDWKELGNGVCDAGRGCNKIECGWDGGDCVNLKKYPDCEIASGRWYEQFGNGICNSKLNTKECGWDGGDCVEFNAKAKQELISGIVICTATFVILNIFVVVYYNVLPMKEEEHQQEIFRSPLLFRPLLQKMNQLIDTLLFLPALSTRKSFL